MVGLLGNGDLCGNALCIGETGWFRTNVTTCKSLERAEIADVL